MDKLCNYLNSCSDRDFNHIRKPCFKVFAYVFVFRGSHTSMIGNINDVFNSYSFQFHSNWTLLSVHISTDINFAGRNTGSFKLCDMNFVSGSFYSLIFLNKTTTHRVIIKDITTLIIRVSFEVICKDFQVYIKPSTWSTAFYTILLIKVEL